ncbi:DUF4345 family protein [Henriciella aquimarina]|uniref:DUF4345 family protein n=1 Tax=Henriciella aquimarina TaxID=545261 RepID=UPI000A055016|nr:DUF4345 family protein [Henriciella aquimarina]
MLIRLFLTLIALLFLVFGLWSISDPLGMTSQLDVEAGGPNAAFEMRGIFGGVSLAAAALTAAGAIRPERFERPALYFLAVYMGGYTLARFASLIMGDSPTLNGWAFASFEVVSFALTCLALRARSRSRTPA